MRKVEDTMVTLSRIDYIILAALYEQNADDSISSMTLGELREVGIGLKRTAMYRHIHVLTDNGYIQESGRDNKAKLYYITQKGKALLGKETK